MFTSKRRVGTLIMTVISDKCDSLAGLKKKATLPYY